MQTTSVKEKTYNENWQRQQRRQPPQLLLHQLNSNISSQAPGPRTKGLMDPVWAYQSHPRQEDGVQARDSISRVTVVGSVNGDIMCHRRIRRRLHISTLLAILAVRHSQRVATQGQEALTLAHPPKHLAIRLLLWLRNPLLSSRVMGYECVLLFLLLRVTYERDQLTDVLSHLTFNFPLPCNRRTSRTHSTGSGRNWRIWCTRSLIQSPSHLSPWTATTLCRSTLDQPCFIRLHRRKGHH